MKLTAKKQILALVFLCAFTYFISYLTRKNFEAIIEKISVVTGNARSSLAIASTGMFITYGVGQLISGFLGDRIQPKHLVTIGLLATSTMNFLMPIRCLPLQIVFWCINGFAQAFMWPPIVKIMTAKLSTDDYNANTQKVNWGSTIATILLYLVSPAIISFSSWEFVFVFCGAFGLLGAVIWWFKCPKIELVERQKPIVTVEKKRGIFAPVLIAVIVGIVCMGMLRDGVEGWMPSFISDRFGVETEHAILSAVILPVFALICFAVVTQIYRKLLKNPMLCAGVVFSLGLTASIVLYFFGGVNMVLSMILFAILTGCMHGVNLVLICILPGYFKNTGRVSLMSGLLNSFTYVGSATMTYLTPLLVEISPGVKDWNLTLILWLAVAILGTLCCLLSIKPWKKYEKRLLSK